MSSILSKDPQHRKETESLDKIIKSLVLYGIFAMLLVALVLFVFFQWEKEFSIGYEIDSSSWGQYGDFFGGVVGTLLAFVSIICLLYAYREQRESNLQLNESNQEMRNALSSSERVSEEQILKETFDSLMILYNEALKGYQVNSSSGHQALDKVVSKFLQEQDFANNESYKKKSKEAMRIFSLFITENYSTVSTHMRLVYQILDLISNAPVDRMKRVRYAKILRSQMSEGELILLRYNCMDPRGQKTARYAFEYNLFKHLPLLSLFEFKPIAEKIVDRPLLSRLNEELIYWRRDICRLFLSSTNKQKRYDYTNRYYIIIEASHDDKQFTLKLHRDTTIVMGRVYDSLAVVFNKLDHLDLDYLFLWFITEVFDVSTFRLYELSKKTIKHTSIPSHNNEISDLNITVSSSNMLVVHPVQLLAPLS